MDSRKLKAKMVLTGMDVTKVCKATGMGKSAYHRKMNGSSEFKQGEIAAIANLMELTDSEVMEIFFDKKVS